MWVVGKFVGKPAILNVDLSYPQKEMNLMASWGEYLSTGI